MADPFRWAWRAGALVPHEQLTIHAESMAMRYALSAFEGVRGYVQQDGATVRFFALGEHIARLHQTLALAGLPPVADGELDALAAGLLEANGAREDCYLRIAVNATSLGTLKGDARTEVFASLQPMGRKPLAGAGLSVAISDRRKPDDDMFPQRAKVICNYAGPRLAYLDAQSRGFDDVVLRTSAGLLSEAPTANLFLVKDGVLMTPRLEDAILAGITRRHVLVLGRGLGLAVEERALTHDDAYAASEAFLCGTGLEIAAIARFDDRGLPAGRTVVPRLIDAYFALVRGAAREEAA